MLEKDIVKTIRDWAKEHDFLVIKFFGSPFAQIGVGDLILCYKGQFICIEVKRPGKEEPTDRQYLWLKKVKDHGGQANWFSNSTAAINWLISIIDRESN